MLYATAGSRLFIADDPGADPTLNLNWVEIGETEAIGFAGVEWDVASVDLATGGGFSVLEEMSVKRALRRPEIPIILGNDPTDPGQIILWTAAMSEDAYPFRLVLPDGETARSWSALVFRMGDVLDAANGVMKLQVDIKPTSNIARE